MDNKEKTEVCEPVVIQLTPEQPSDQNGVESMIPAMNVSMSEQKEGALISDEKYMGVLEEIMSNIRDDRKQANELLDTFADMVLNDGDATTSSKEALVNLVKHKADLQDKMLKAATLMTQLKLKNTYAYSGPHLNAMQQNNFNLGGEAPGFNKKDLIKAINQAKKKRE
jgi:hypothetical protein